MSHGRIDDRILFSHLLMLREAGDPLLVYLDLIVRGSFCFVREFSLLFKFVSPIARLSCFVVFSYS